MLSRTVILVLVLIVLGTTFFTVQPDPPEMVRAQSLDGLARVEALVQQGGDVRLKDVTLSIRKEDGGPSTARVSPIYEIVRRGGFGELGGTFFFVSALDDTSHALGFWNDNHEAWQVESASTYHDGAFSSSTLLPLRWALFQRQDVEIPRRYEQITAELVNHRPGQTDRAFINLAYAFESDDFVLIPSARVTAGCGGNLQASRGRTEKEEVIESLMLTVNGQEREGWIRVRAQWELEDGCAEGETFELVK